MMKYKTRMLAAAALILLSLSSCHDGRKAYSEKDKTDPVGSSMSSSSGSSAYEPGIDLGVRNADLIVQGAILSKGRKVFVPVFSDGSYPELGFSYYRYDFRIDEVWFGECPEESIPLYIPAECAQLRKNDRAVFFLRRIEDQSEEDYCRPVNMERSFFVINPPDDTLFSLDTDEGCTKYDGEDPAVLMEDIASRMLEYAGEKDYAPQRYGAALQAYVSLKTTDN